MSVLLAATTTHNFNMEQIKKLIAADLAVPAEAVTISFDMQDFADERRSSTSDYRPVGIIVKIDNSKVKEKPVFRSTEQFNAKSENFIHK